MFTNYLGAPRGELARNVVEQLRGIYIFKSSVFSFQYSYYAAWSSSAYSV